LVDPSKYGRDIGATAVSRWPRIAAFAERIDHQHDAHRVLWDQRHWWRRLEVCSVSEECPPLQEFARS